jgi:hypothetical protein
MFNTLVHRPLMAGKASLLTGEELFVTGHGVLRCIVTVAWPA